MGLTPSPVFLLHQHYWSADAQVPSEVLAAFAGKEPELSAAPGTPDSLGSFSALSY